MTAATIIVVIKFSVYNLPSTKKINDSAVYFRINNLLNGTCLIALSRTTPFLRKYFRLTFTQSVHVCTKHQ